MWLVDMISGIGAVDGVTLLHHSDRTFLLHLGGKIEVVSRAPIRTRDGTPRRFPAGQRIYDDLN